MEMDLKSIIQNIDGTESTKWASDMREVSVNIKTDLSDYLSKKRVLKTGCLLDLCNGIKSLLTIYNFGALDSEESLINRGASEDAVKEFNARRNEDKNTIRTGIEAILKYVETNGYDLSPLISAEDCQSIFVSGDEKIPVVFSMAAVFTTFIYLRRAIKRIGLFTIEELEKDSPGMYQKVVMTTSSIMEQLITYATKNNYKGWGFTIKSKVVTLNDTYVVADAISRFGDAFDNKGEKRDQEFMDAVDTYGGTKKSEALSERLLSALYKVAYNVYDSVRNVYGDGVFYANVHGNNVEYTRCEFREIASSNRSSALFNPLYVAMITMMGYNDKELVIRKFMDDYTLVNKYYDKYKNDLIAFSQSGDVKWYAGKNFEDECSRLLLPPHAPVSQDYSGKEENWRNYYRVARVMQKFLEIKHKEELMDISEYRDYLNATKDAIDQVYVMYRKFQDMQRFGIVDTDYVMFSKADINTDAFNISKLNKANIAVNSLRPLLLSAKIMIVNALTKYPQADISDIYESIKKSIHVNRNRQGKGDPVWLWNEDEIDMNATVKNCEAIAYDYFDYYDKYELGFIAVREMRKKVSEAVVKNINPEDGGLKPEALENQGGEIIKELVLDVTRKNIDLVKTTYQTELLSVRKQQKENADKEAATYRTDIDEKAKKIDELKKDKQSLLDDNKFSSMFREMIRSEINVALKRILSMIILGKINNDINIYSYDAEKLKEERGDIIDGNFPAVRQFIEYQCGLLSDDTEADKRQTDKVNDDFKQLSSDAMELEELILAAFDGNLGAALDYNVDVRSTEDIDEKNDIVERSYSRMKEENDAFRSAWFKNITNDNSSSLTNLFRAFGREHDILHVKNPNSNDEDKK